MYGLNKLGIRYVIVTSSVHCKVNSSHTIVIIFQVSLFDEIANEGTKDKNKKLLDNGSSLLNTGKTTFL
jgi:hypothetical protein